MSNGSLMYLQKGLDFEILNKMYHHGWTSRADSTVEIYLSSVREEANDYDSSRISWKHANCIVASNPQSINLMRLKRSTSISHVKSEDHLSFAISGHRSFNVIQIVTAGLSSVWWESWGIWFAAVLQVTHVCEIAISFALFSNAVWERPVPYNLDQSSFSFDKVRTW